MSRFKIKRRPNPTSLTCHDRGTFWCGLKSNSTSIPWYTKHMPQTVQQCHGTVTFTSPNHHRFSLVGQRMSGTNIYAINETSPSGAFSEWPWNVELSKGKNTTASVRTRAAGDSPCLGDPPQYPKKEKL